MARNVAQESIALLQNNNNALPLNQNKINTIALIGPEVVGKLDLLGVRKKMKYRKKET